MGGLQLGGGTNLSEWFTAAKRLANLQWRGRELGRGESRESGDGFARCKDRRWQLSQPRCCSMSRTDRVATVVGWTREDL